MTTSTRTGGREATKGVIPGRIAISVGKASMPEPEGFAWRPLTELARLESGHTPSRSKPEYWGGPVPWIGIRDATGHQGEVIFETLDSITQAGLDNSSARLLPAGTVCLSRTASVGYVVEMGEPMATSQDFVNWVCGPELNPRYLRYVLMLEQDSIRRFSHGTTHQTMYYPEAKALHLLAPDRHGQDAIAEVLGALDDKIAATDRTLSCALELDDLEVRALLRDSKRTTPLADLADVIKGVSYRRSDLSDSETALVTLKSVDRTGRFAVRGFKAYVGDFKERQRLVAGDIVVAQTDLTQGAEVIGWAVRVPEIHEFTRLVASLDLAIVRTKTDIAMEYILAALRQPAFRRHCHARMSGTTVLHLGRGAIESYEVPLVREGAIAQYTEIAKARHSLVDSLSHENAQLMKTRDELLPLLMSGKLRVKDAERVVSDAV
jgi:type I restriction enzyme S subunit